MNDVKEEWYPYCHQSLAIITIMADFSNNTVQIETVSKGVAKRKYLLLDEDLEDLKYQLKDNPVNKSYGKCEWVYRLSDTSSMETLWRIHFLDL